MNLPAVAGHRPDALAVIRCQDRHGYESASAGNRTRVTSMATMYSTTRPLMLYNNQYEAVCCDCHTRTDADSRSPSGQLAMSVETQPESAARASCVCCLIMQTALFSQLRRLGPKHDPRSGSEAASVPGCSGVAERPPRNTCSMLRLQDTAHAADLVHSPRWFATQPASKEPSRPPPRIPRRRPRRQRRKQ
jgi:hypothetical protein